MGLGAPQFEDRAWGSEGRSSQLSRVGCVRFIMYVSVDVLPSILPACKALCSAATLTTIAFSAGKMEAIGGACLIETWRVVYEIGPCHLMVGTPEARDAFS